MSKLFKPTKLVLPIRELSQNPQIVHQNGIAYVKHNVPKKPKFKPKPEPAIFTSAATCHLVALKDKTGSRALLHVDTGLDSVTALHKAIAHLVNLGVFGSSAIEDALLIRSPFSFFCGTTFLTLKLMGMEPRVVNAIDPRWRFILPSFPFVGYTEEGELAEFARESVSKAAPYIFEEARKNQGIYTEATRRRTLYCDTELKYISDVRPFDSLPNVPAFSFDSARSPKASEDYEFNIPLGNPERFAVMGLPQIAGARYEVKSSSEGEYLHIWTDGNATDQKINAVQTILMEIAKQI